MDKKMRVVLLTMTLLAASTEVWAALVNVDFNQDFNVVTMSGAAVLGGTGDTWNGVNGNFNSSPAFSSLALLDSTGTSSALTLTAPSLRHFDAGSSTTPPLYSGSAGAVMRDYVFAAAGVTQTLTLAGLDAGTEYRLILYSSTNAAGRTTDFAVDGMTKSVSAVATATLTEAVNYADFTAVADSSGQIAFSFTGNGTESSLNGFQIQPAAAIPESSSAAVLSLISLFAAGWKWREAGSRSAISRGDG